MAAAQLMTPTASGTPAAPGTPAALGRPAAPETPVSSQGAGSSGPRRFQLVCSRSGNQQIHLEPGLPRIVPIPHFAPKSGDNNSGPLNSHRNPLASERPDAGAVSEPKALSKASGNTANKVSDIPAINSDDQLVSPSTPAAAAINR